MEISRKDTGKVIRSAAIVGLWSSASKYVRKVVM